MKLKKALIIIEDHKETSKRWLKALKGKTVDKKENVIICSDVKVAEKLFSAPRLNILMTIISKEPASIKKLAEYMEKDFKNIYNDVMFLSDLGIIELVEHGKQKALKPIPKYSGLEIKLAA